MIKNTYNQTGYHGLTTRTADNLKKEQVSRMLRITPEIMVPESELTEDYIRASGPGGQHVNKSNTAVKLRFNIRESPYLSEYARERLLRVLANKINSNGEIVIDARRFRSREQNRRDAEERLVDVLRQALIQRRRRIATTPTGASQQRRLASKRQRSENKKRRTSVIRDDEGL